jgi:uncharacterized Rossmann fold enzyme
MLSPMSPSLDRLATSVIFVVFCLGAPLARPSCRRVAINGAMSKSTEQMVTNPRATLIVPDVAASTTFELKRRTHIIQWDFD